ncbi:MAG: PLP-dependent transferase [Opitutaceae bacterium]
MNSLRHFPLGDPFPSSPHAVISSLPTMADVRGYEEHDLRVVEAMASGYPRFVVHVYIRKLIDFYIHREALAGRAAVLIPGRRAAEDVLLFVGSGAASQRVEDAVYLVHVDASDDSLAYKLRKFVQHTGCGISSRQAEDILFGYGKLESVFEEASYPGAALPEAERLLAEQIGCRTQDVLVCASGMNAFYAGYRAVQEYQLSRGRKRWLQLGWLYLDSGCVLKEFLHDEETLECCYDVFDLDVVLDKIRSYGDDLSAVVVECPTNPLIQVCELQKVASLVRELGGVMIVDPTIASVYNVDVLPYADLLVSSLTKYAATEGDVMIGALAVNAESSHYGDLVLRTAAFYQPPYLRDLARLVYEMSAAPSLVEKMNENAVQLSAFLRAHPKVERVYCATLSEHIEDVAKANQSGGAVISIRLKGDIEPFYDSIQLMKGPSFGARFTLLCPFVYLAHYDLVTDPEGRAFLESAGISPELIRISVGTEPYQEIEAVFASALDQMV